MTQGDTMCAYYDRDAVLRDYQRLNGIDGWMLVFIIWYFIGSHTAVSTIMNIPEQFGRIGLSPTDGGYRFLIGFSAMLQLGNALMLFLCGLFLACKLKVAVITIKATIVTNIVIGYLYFICASSIFIANGITPLVSVFMLIGMLIATGLGITQYLYFARSRRIAITLGFFKPPELQHNSASGNDYPDPHGDTARQIPQPPSQYVERGE